MISYREDKAYVGKVLKINKPAKIVILYSFYKCSLSLKLPHNKMVEIMINRHSIVAEYIVLH